MNNPNDNADLVTISRDADHYDYTPYLEVRSAPPTYLALIAFSLISLAIGLGCAWHLDHHGHGISGMNNKIVWGLPHVFAISLIVISSGVLNVATISSVFSVKDYRPFARLSALLSLAFLIGGLLVLVLDLGRPDRLIVAMTHYNFTSIFTWNIFLYTGLMLLVVVYLVTMMERRLQPWTARLGALTLFWRIVLTSGTGSIFGFLVGRSGYDSAILAPLFIGISLAMGTAVFDLLVSLLNRWYNLGLTQEFRERLARLLVVFSIATLYFSLVHHITNLYAQEHQSDVWSMLLTSSVSTWMYWLGHVALGVLVPTSLYLLRRGTKRRASALSIATFSINSVLVILGCSALLYSIIIGGQNIALEMFPGMIVQDTRLGTTALTDYTPRLWEVGLGLGAIGLALLIVLLGIRVLPFLPKAATQ